MTKEKDHNDGIHMAVGSDGVPLPYYVRHV
jgi:hypothetical protein